jgi:hypothetical protein
MTLRFAWPYALTVALYCAAIFYLSSRPIPEDVEVIFFVPGMDKALHGLLYAGLAALVSVGLWRSNERLSRARLVWIPTAFATLYGLSDEIHQRFVPQRTFELADLVADFAGAWIAAHGLARFVLPRLPLRGARVAERNPNPDPSYNSQGEN